jgi:WD40 repeat protein
VIKIEDKSMKTIILVLTASLMIVGCSPEVKNSVPTEINLNQNQKILTPTTVPETLAAFTATIAIEAKVNVPVKTCENNGSPTASTKDFKSSGEVVFLSSDQNKLKALNLETQKISTIQDNKDNRLSIFGLSPNKKWFAFADLTHDSNGKIRRDFNLELVSDTGETKKHQMNISDFEDLFMGDVFVGFGSSYWINDNLIYTTLLVQNPSKYGSKTPTYLPVIIDPFTGSWDNNLLSFLTESNRRDEIGFSPDLQHVVMQDQKIKLKDLKNNKELWSNDRFFLEIPQSKVRWSPNGKFVAIGNRFPVPQILVVSTDGTKSETVPLENISGLLEFEWSPNSQSIMMYHSYSDQEKNFYLYDMGKQQIVFKCPVQQPWDIVFQWSPDSNQVIFGTQDGYLQILDIPSGRVAKLDVQNALPLSWANKSFSH